MRNGATGNSFGRDAIIKGKQKTERKGDAIPEDDPHKVEKLIKIGRSDIDPDAGSD